MIHTILFTGHMMDAAGRPSPRFPAEREEVVRQEIGQRLMHEKAAVKNALRGIAGGACGGDILFHEVCLQLDIHTEMYLASPIEAFIETSVSFAGDHWVSRFQKLVNTIPLHLQSQVKDAAIWEQINATMLDSALANGSANMTLLSVWDGKSGDGPGGTAHMIKTALEYGVRIEIIDV